MENNFAPKDIRGIPDEVIQEQLQKGIKNLKKDDKYFTPSIEDIRVGYECEWKTCKEETCGFEPYKFRNGGNVFNGIGDNGSEWKKLEISDTIGFHKWQPSVLRTPYLTKEQIEAEGWINTTNPLNINIWSFEKGNRFIILRMNDLENPFILHVKVKDPSIEELVLGMPSEHFRFTAPCKDINTFRYICKLLGI